MTVMISCIVAWIIFSTIMNIIICVNRGQINRQQERFDRDAFIEHWLKQEEKHE